MTVFENIKAMDIDKFAEWYEEICAYDNDDPAIKWWNDTYCNRCEQVIGKYLNSDREMDFCWCELYDKCQFFQNMDRVPDSKEMIKAWLESEL